MFRFHRPILWQNEDNHFLYSIGGTANIVKFRGRFLLLTAKHCLNRSGYSIEDVRIPYRISSQTYLLIGKGVEFYEIESPEEYSCRCDVQIHDIWGESAPETPLEEGEYLEIDSFTPSDQNGPRILTGFPVETQWQKFDEKRFGGKGMMIGGVDNGPTSDPSCRFFHSRWLRGNDADGFSGGLVTSPTSNGPQLEGICLQGGGCREIDFIRFLDVAALRTLFEIASDRLNL